MLADVAAALGARGSLVGPQYGPYRILSLLGAGGRREARTLASLNHHNTAPIYGLEESAEVDYLVLELVEGDTLDGPLPLATALDRARQVAEAFEAAHEHGIIHRDLKPANLKVTGPARGCPGRVKVLARIPLG